MGRLANQIPTESDLARRWTMQLTLQRTPICPGCGTILLPSLTRFWKGYAVCPQFTLEASGNCNDVIPLMLNDHLRPFFAIQAGLLFFIPRDRPAENIVAFAEWLRVMRRQGDES